MQSEQQYSNLVYEYFLKRIQFRYYKSGDYLPSIDTLCREFCVSGQTVKTALRRLRAEGYLDMHNGRSTKIIFQQDKQQSDSYIQEYFACRIANFYDLYESMKMIFMPLLSKGLHRCSRKDLDHLFRLSEGTGTSDIFRFFSFILQKMENPLAMNLFWETSIYWGLLFMRQDEENDPDDTERMRQELRRCIESAREKNWAQLDEQLMNIRKNSVDTAFGFLSTTIPPARMEDRIPFTWRIYRDRPQVCYSLAAHLLHEIYIGGFCNTAFLPSYEKMAGQYGVSVSTMRRTVKMLNQIGAARSINGKGTQVFGIGQPACTPDLECPAIRHNLAFFIQSFELLLYSCEAVFLDFLSTTAPIHREELLHKLEENLQKGCYEISLWCCLLSITRHSRLAGIREIYGRIYSLFLWGYPLKADHACNPQLDRAILDFTKEMIQGLKENDAGRCAKAAKQLVARQFPKAEQYLIRLGFGQDELRLAPSIRLLVSEEEQNGSLD